MNVILIMEGVTSLVTIHLVAITVHVTTVTHSMLTIICVMVSININQSHLLYSIRY